MPLAFGLVVQYPQPVVEVTEVEAKIKAGIPDAELVRVEDMTGTKDHLSAVVVAASFSGLSRVAQHQAVYRALGEWMHGPIHALALETHTPESYRQKISRG